VAVFAEVAASGGGQGEHCSQLLQQRHLAVSHPADGSCEGLLNAADDGVAVEKWHAKILCSLGTGKTGCRRHSNRLSRTGSSVDNGYLYPVS
jgi:hypothetical protein